MTFTHRVLVSLGDGDFYSYIAFKLLNRQQIAFIIGLRGEARQMIADTLTITAVVAEIRALVGARIEQIYQPTPSELLLYLYEAGEKKCLLLSTHPGRSRLHLTEQSYRHPEEPPSFCMLLRKYLDGGVILEIEQPPAERIVEFTVRSMDGIFTVALIAELMGRRSNLILVDRSEGEQQILGALKNIGWEQNPYRASFRGRATAIPRSPISSTPMT